MRVTAEKARRTGLIALVTAAALGASACGDVPARQQPAAASSEPAPAQRNFVMRTVDFSHYAARQACKTACTLPIYKTPARPNFANGTDVGLDKVLNSPLPEQTDPAVIWTHGSSVRPRKFQIAPSRLKVVCQVAGTVHTSANTKQSVIFDVVEVDDTLPPAGQNGQHINAQALKQIETGQAQFGFEVQGKRVEAFGFAQARWLGGDEVIAGLRNCTPRQNPHGYPPPEAN